MTTEPTTPLARLSRRVQDVPPSGIRKFFDVLASMPDVISLGVGEPDFDTPEVVVEAGVDGAALRAAPTTPATTAPSSCARRCRAPRSRATTSPTTRRRRWSSPSVPRRPCAIAMTAVIDPGDEVVLAEPSYVAYVPDIIFAGGTPVFVPTRPDDGWQLDPDAVEAAITPRTKVLFLGFPNNPTGAVLEPERIRALAAHRRAPRPARHQRRDLRPARLRRPSPRGLQRPARHARAHHPAGRLLQGLRHDRLARRLRLRARGPARGHHEGPPVHHHVRPHDRPGCGAGGARRRPRTTSSAWSPSTTAAGACSWPGSSASACPRSNRAAPSTPSPTSPATRPLAATSSASGCCTRPAWRSIPGTRLRAPAARATCAPRWPPPTRTSRRPSCASSASSPAL